MTDVAVAIRDAATSGSWAAPAAAATRAVSHPRSARVLLQVGCLGAVGVALRTESSALGVLVVAQAVAGAGAFGAYSMTRSVPAAARRTLRVWGIGAALSVVAALALGAGSLELRWAQLGVVGLLVVLAGLGRMRDSFRAAGSQLDAFLATLPPPTTSPAQSGGGDHRSPNDPPTGRPNGHM